MILRNLPFRLLIDKVLFCGIFTINLGEKKNWDRKIIEEMNIIGIQYLKKNEIHFSGLRQ